MHRETPNNRGFNYLYGYLGGFIDYWSRSSGDVRDLHENYSLDTTELSSDIHSMEDNIRIIDWNALDENVEGDHDFLVELMNDFFNDFSRWQADIEHGIQNKNFDLITGAADCILGSASYLRCDALRQCSRQLLDAAKLGRNTSPDDTLLNQIMVLSNNLNKEIVDLKKEYERHMQQLQSRLS